VYTDKDSGNPFLFGIQAFNDANSFYEIRKNKATLITEKLWSLIKDNVDLIDKEVRYGDKQILEKQIVTDSK